MILLDTHVLIWLTSGHERLGPRARQLADRALEAGTLAVSSISFWEIEVLAAKKRIVLAFPPKTLREDLLRKGLVEIPLSGDLAIAASKLEHLHPDPADRFIVATSLAYAATLVTADGRILAWKGSARRHDART